MGSGRTRLLRALFGLEAVKKGTLRIGVYSGGALGAGPRGRWRAGMGLLSEDRKSEGLQGLTDRRVPLQPAAMATGRAGFDQSPDFIRHRRPFPRG